MTKWLKAHRFSWKKCNGCPAKADPKAQAQFVKEYRQLKAGLKESEVLVFLDAVHPTMTTKLVNAWSIKGERKTLSTTGSKKRLNILGSLNSKTLEMVSTFHKSVNTSAMGDHFKALRKTYSPRKSKCGFYKDLKIIGETG
jgi:hypothetical protein